MAGCQLQPLGGCSAPDLPAHPNPAGGAGFPKRAAADYGGVFLPSTLPTLLLAHHTSGHGAAGACTVQPFSVPLLNDVASVCAFQHGPCTPLHFTRLSCRLSWSATAGTGQSGGVGSGNSHCTERAGKRVCWHAIGTGGCSQTARSIDQSCRSALRACPRHIRKLVRPPLPPLQCTPASVRCSEALLAAAGPSVDLDLPNLPIALQMLRAHVRASRDMIARQHRQESAELAQKAVSAGCEAGGRGWMCCC